MRRIGREYDFVMKNINRSSLFIAILPPFHFFSCTPYINKLVISRILSSLFYLINYCIFDTYKLVPKRARQKGKILPNSTLTTYRQNSKFVKILYIKMRFKVMGDMIYISYGDRVTDGQRQGRSGEDMVNSRYRDIVTDEQRQSRGGEDMMNSRYKEIGTCEHETW